MIEPCRVTVPVASHNGYGRTARRIHYRRVESLAASEDGRLLHGRIRIGGHYQLVYRVSGDTTWTSIREEATGLTYERLAKVVQS